MSKIVLAYSGSLATSAAIPWLMERYGVEVVTVTLDVGQGVELAHVREQALAAGAVRAHVIDARDEFVRRHVLTQLRSGVFAQPAAFSSVAQTRPLIARRVVELARMEGTATVAHGCGCEDPDRLLFEEALRGADPSIVIIAPACEWKMSPADVMEYARSRRLAVASMGREEVDGNLLGRTFYAASTSQPFKLTRAIADAPDGAAFIELEFAAGTPIRTNGVDMPVIEIIESIETIAGAHGVGRVPIDAETVAESPAAVVLHVAYSHLAARHADLTGVVRLRLLKGACDVVGVTDVVSPLRPAQHKATA
jgi:argininosuccinate synthase